MSRNKWVAWLFVGVIITIGMLLVSCSSSPTSPSMTSTVIPATTTPTTPAPNTSNPPPQTSANTPAPTTTSAPPATTSNVPGSTPQYGGTLSIIASAVPVLMPIPNIPAPAAVYLFPTVEPLIGLNKDGPVPTKLATSWDWSADGKTLTLHLRKGVKFQDGTDFNAAAVKFNLDREIGVRAEVSSLKSVDVVDDSTVRLNLSNYSNTLLQQLAYVAGLIESPASIESHDRSWFSNHAVGTGPFELVSFDPPTSMVFKKFNGYWDSGKPYLDGLKYIFVTDPTTAELAFRAGAAQAWDQLLPVNLKSLASQNLGIKTNSVPKSIWMAMGNSTRQGSPFAKLEVRQAIDYAIDKKAVTNTFGFSTWEAPNQPISSYQSGYSTSFQGRDYNPAKAKQLLADAGYAGGFQTKLTVRNNFDLNVIGAYQAYLKAVGISAEIVPADTGAYMVLLTKGWDGIIVSGLGVAGSYGKMMQSDGPNPGWGVSITLTDNYKNALNAAVSAQDKAGELKATQNLVQTVFDEAYMLPWNIDSINCAYTNAVHFDLDTISVQFWNPGDAWLSSTK